MPEAVNLLWLFWWQPQQHVDVIEVPPRALFTITGKACALIGALVWTDTRVRYMGSISTAAIISVNGQCDHAGTLHS